MALVIMAIISELHLGGKLMSRPVQAIRPKYTRHRFSSVTKANIEM